MFDFEEQKEGICSRIGSRFVVAFFIPNLIGYTRFALLFIGCYFAFSKDPNENIFFPACYGLSQALDGVDGWAARKFD